MSDESTSDDPDLDPALIAKAEKLVSGRGDGRLSREDAEALLETITEAGGWGRVERDTVEHLREHFEWTEAAEAWFDTAVRKWAADQSRS